MTFIGESRRKDEEPWSAYICLSKDTCKDILPLVEKELGKREKKLEHYTALNEVQSLTPRQDEKMFALEEECGRLESLAHYIKEYLKY